MTAASHEGMLRTSGVGTGLDASEGPEWGRLLLFPAADEAESIRAVAVFLQRSERFRRMQAAAPPANMWPVFGHVDSGINEACSGKPENQVRRGSFSTCSSASTDADNVPSMGYISSDATAAGAAPDKLGPAMEEETATTLMICNLPCKVDRGKLVAALSDMGLDGKYDFLHIPMTHRQESNLGYAFVNMHGPEGVRLLNSRFEGFRFEGCTGSAKACTVRPARLQGLGANEAQLGRRRRRRRKARGGNKDAQPAQGDNDNAGLESE